MKVQVAIVSAQPLANLIPALMWQPDHVFLLTSPAMANKGLDDRHRRILDEAGIPATVVSGMPDCDAGRIRSFTAEFLHALMAEATDAELIVNVTGGTKLMALAAYDVVRDIHGVCIYTDTARRRIELLPGRSSQMASQLPMRSVIDVKQHLMAQGVEGGVADSDRPAWQGQAQARQSATFFLGKHAARLDRFFGILNGLADNALERGDGYTEVLVQARQVFQKPLRGLWGRAALEMEQAGLIRLIDQQAFEFVDATAARFLRGGWLEEYVWHRVRAARPFDVRCGQQVTWPAGVRNELDLVATHDNRLLVVECKTANLRSGPDYQLDKLDSIARNLEALFATVWFVTARPPTAAMRKLASRQNIRLIDPEGIPRLHQAIQQWMAGD